MTIPVGSILRYIRARGGGLCVCPRLEAPLGVGPQALTQGTSVGGYLTYLGHVVGRCCVRCWCYAWWVRMCTSPSMVEEGAQVHAHSVLCTLQQRV